MDLRNLKHAGILGALKKPHLPSMQSMFLWKGRGMRVPLLKVLALGVQVWGGQVLSQYQVNYKDKSVSSLLPAGICFTV